MKKLIALLVVAAVLAVVFISGCTQQPSGPATGGVINKAAEDKAAAALESELDQAVANMSTSDIENALLNQ
jgi:outer membrane lipoprotein-sorting protein